MGSHADVAGVCTDSKGNVYLFCRGDHPVMIFDRDGKFLDSWGEGGEFSYRVHGMHMGKDDSLYLVDDSNHRVAKYTLDGKCETITVNGKIDFWLFAKKYDGIAVFVRKIDLMSGRTLRGKITGTVTGPTLVLGNVTLR